MYLNLHNSYTFIAKSIWISFAISIYVRMHGCVCVCIYKIFIGKWKSAVYLTLSCNTPPPAAGIQRKNIWILNRWIFCQSNCCFFSYIFYFFQQFKSVENFLSKKSHVIKIKISFFSSPPQQLLPSFSLSSSNNFKQIIFTKEPVVLADFFFFRKKI